jgi:hypothetical protein
MIGRKILANCFLFMAVGMGIYAGFELMNYALLKKDDGFVQSLEYFEQVSNSQGLVLGDSHPAYDIDPEALGEGWHNFSYPGENLVMTYFKLKYALAKGHRPSYVVLPLDLHSFSVYRSIGTDYSNALSFTTSEELRKVVGFQAWAKSVIKSYLPLTSTFNRQQFLEYGIKRLKSCVFGEKEVLKKFTVSKRGHLESHQKGFVEMSLGERDKVATARYSEQMKPPLLSPLLVEYFLKIIALCKERDILLVGVRYPLSGPYYEHVRTNPDISDVVRLYQSSGGNFLIMKDYSQLYLDRDEYFNDADHLNVRGSAEFSKLLASELAGNSLLRVPL